MNLLTNAHCPVCKKDKLNIRVMAPIDYACFTAIIDNGLLQIVSPPRMIHILQRGHELTMPEGRITCADCGFVGGPEAFNIRTTDGRIFDEEVDQDEDEDPEDEEDED